MKLIDVGGRNNEIIPDGYQEWIIDTLDPLTLDLTCDGISSVFVNIKKASKLGIKMTVLENAGCSLLIWNNTTSPVEFDENYVVNKNSYLNLAYGECNTADIQRNSIVSLVDDGATAMIKSATLCKNKKNTSILCQSLAPHTTGNMENYSVVLEGGDYKMEATGKIHKGAYGSKSHQTSRALTFDDKQKATIIPKLLIDENDVEASHATSVGQIDENQMVYLQSRGLTQKQVLSLITIGYLMPIADFIENEELQTVLRREIESKVVESCSI
ncbi:SufD family Fe-S cluster assembly protein [Anaerorhabdus sp.]|uniref:SufD family Fe-S cluster assembly protein n=1 Tax=Anaerorhabdus sp. TaxID=1872524 RepID=UPI002FCA1217